MQALYMELQQLATTFGASRMQRAIHVMEHNIDTCFALIGGIIASCRMFPTLGHDIGMTMDPNEGEFEHGCV